METKTLHGSCKCGTVKFEADVDLSKGSIKCNCTSCWKRRWWTVAVKPPQFRSLAGDDSLSEHGHFCTKCGVIPYALMPKQPWNDGEYYAVNVAVFDDLDPGELMGAPIRICDGRNNNWFEQPEFVAHL